jgi:gas vesicle protein
MAEDSKFPYFLLGLGVGFVAGIFVAPRSGEETIHYLKEKAGEGKEYLGRQQETLRTAAQGAVEKGRDALVRQKEQVAAAYEAGRSAYRESVATGPKAEMISGEGESI